jgi:alkylhydroperoxidase family enzyme
MVALADYQNYEGFSEAEKTAIALAEELTLNPSRVPLKEEFHAVGQKTQIDLKKHYDEAQIVELVVGVAFFNFLNRFNRFMEPDLDMEAPPDELLAVMG